MKMLTKSPFLNQIPLYFNIVILVGVSFYSLSRTLMEIYKYLIPVLIFLYYFSHSSARKEWIHFFRRPIIWIFCLWIISWIGVSIFYASRDTQYLLSFSKNYYHIYTILSYSLMALSIPFLFQERLFYKAILWIFGVYILGNCLSIGLFYIQDLPTSRGLLNYTSLYGKSLSIEFTIFVGFFTYIFFFLKYGFDKKILFFFMGFIILLLDIRINDSRSLVLTIFFTFLFLFLVFLLLYPKKRYFFLFLFFFALFIIPENLKDKVLESTNIYLKKENIIKLGKMEIVSGVDIQDYFQIMFTSSKPIESEVELSFFSSEKEHRKVKRSAQVVNPNLEEYSLYVFLTEKNIDPEYRHNIRFHFFVEGEGEEIITIDLIKEQGFPYKYEIIEQSHIKKIQNIFSISISEISQIRINPLKEPRINIFRSSFNIAKRSFDHKRGLYYFKYDYKDPNVNQFAPIILNSWDTNHYHAHNNFLFFYTGFTWLGYLFLLFTGYLLLFSIFRLYGFISFFKDHSQELAMEQKKEVKRYLLFYIFVFILFANQNIYGLFDLTIISLPTDFIYWLSKGLLFKLIHFPQGYYDQFKSN